MKIVILDGQVMGGSASDFPALQELGDLTVYDITPPELVIPRIGDAEIVVVDKTPITEEILKACPTIRFIAVLATGYNIVDVQAARRLGIPVANVPGYAGPVVAQATIALLLEAYSKVGIHDVSVHKGDWTKTPYFCYTCGPILEVSGKTLGIVGLGDIGTRVARIASAMGMNVITFTRTRREVDIPGLRFVSLEELLRESDVVSLHVPLFPETDQADQSPAPEGVRWTRSGPFCFSAAGPDNSWQQCGKSSFQRSSPPDSFQVRARFAAWLPGHSRMRFPARPCSASRSARPFLPAVSSAVQTHRDLPPAPGGSAAHPWSFPPCPAVPEAVQELISLRFL